jgi:hypothetical protein
VFQDIKGVIMNPTVVGIIVFTCTFGGTLLGMRLRGILLEHHVSGESKDTVKVAIGLIATMTALVLGLVTASAKSSFDSVNTSIKQTAAQVLALDRTLARYGPEAQEIRQALKQAVGERLDRIWPQHGLSGHANLDILHSGSHAGEKLADAIRNLKPNDDSQQALKSRALDLAETILQTKWLVLAGTESSIPPPFLVVLLFWLTVTFVSFGVFSRPNVMVITALFLCALSIGGALFLVLEMDKPFDGLITVSADPIRYAYRHLGQ